ncbi:hypothetical protein FD723_24965 [Nostoc sp. C052]|uniref:hypothetical protein n=1 Tax=Nostoc sp. C052 TaxID=2576902 RepID=UPI0015C3CE8E|nr:hypothetical protein [Nostoc sp. C052]QLE43381.1 hypothetical protein FD723_24965 [Nostoc sp. C052]
MKLVKLSSQKLICKSNSFGFTVAGFAFGMGGIGFPLLLFPTWIECLKDKVCYETSIRFQSSVMLQAFVVTLIGIVMVMIGYSFTKRTSIQKIVFDLARNQLVIEKSWIFLRKVEKKQYSLSEICDVNVDILKDSGSDPDTYRVVVLLTNGISIPLDMYYSGNEEWHRETAEKIRNFLSLP